MNLITVYRLQHEVEQKRREVEALKGQDYERYWQARRQYLLAQSRLYEATHKDSRP